MNLNKTLKDYLEDELNIRTKHKFKILLNKEGSSFLSLFTNCNSRTKEKHKDFEDKIKENESSCLIF